MPRLLLVDDDAVDRKAVFRALKDVDAEFHIVEAEDGERALSALDKGGFDCVLIDFRLPDMDGLDLLERIVHRDADGHPPVVMLTGEGSELVAVKAMKSGAEDYLPKTAASKETLFRALQNAMERHRMRRDLAAARRQMEHMALTDALTGLGNRNAFRDYIHKTLAAARRNGSTAAVMLLDLDKFKQVNDIHGHEAGDAVLAEVGRRLRDLGREADAFFRLGGDEFAAVVDTGATPGGVEIMAQKIVDSLSQPIVFKGWSLGIGVSVGIALYPRHGEEPDALLHLADAAMYAAKRGDLGFMVASLAVPK